MTFEELEQTIADSIATRKVPSRRGEQRARLLPASYLAPIVSTSRTTLAYQIAKRYNVSREQAVELMRSGEDVAPYLMSMPAAAKERAQGGHASDDHARHRRPGNSAYLARLALYLACPGGTHQVWSKGGTHLVPDGWRPIIEAVDRTYASYGETTRRAQMTVIRALARAAWSAGFESPRDLPIDRTEAQRRLQLSGLGKDSYANVAINTYNRAAKLLAATDSSIPILSQRMDSRLRGLRALPPTAFGGASDYSHDRTSELLARVAPSIDQSLREYQQHLRGRDEKPKMHTARRAHVGRLVALLWRRQNLLASARSAVEGPVPSSLAECEMTDLYTLEVPGHRRGGAAWGDDGTSAADSIAARLTRRGGARTADVRYQPLIRVLLDAAADEIRDGGGNDISRLPYQPSVRTMLDTATKITRDLLRSASKRQDATAAAMEPIVSCVNAVHRTVQIHMKEANLAAVQEGRASAVDKEKALSVSVLTLPQLVCVGLPRLAERCREFERVYRAVVAGLERVGNKNISGHEQVRRAQGEWYDALEEYVVLSVFTAHPIRLSNIAYGRIGSTEDAEWRFDVEYSSAGHPVRVRSVRGRFADRLHQLANPIAALKQKGKSQIWAWWPAIIDHDLLLQYLITVRQERVIARALLRDADGVRVTRTTYSLRDELARPALALFIPLHNLKKNTDPLAYNGGFAGASVLSDIAGRGLHRVARDIFGHTEIPPFDRCGEGRWRGLFAGHIVRLLWSTYWYGLRQDLQRSPVLADGTRVSGKHIAEWATTDEERTLSREYTSVSAEMTARLLDPIDSWTHPRAYDSWMDRALRQEAIDWPAERVPLPPGLAHINRSAAVARPANVRRARTR